jgi:hypothetical protein
MASRWLRAACGLALGLLAAPAPAQAPLSAIDWLSDSLAAPSLPGADLYPVTPPVTEASAITVSTLDAPRPEAVGLFPASRAGLPANFWGTSSAAELSPLIRRLPGDTLPALRELALRILLAEFTPPALVPGPPAAGEGTEAPQGPRRIHGDPGVLMLGARIERLTAFGALDQVAALLEALDPPPVALARARFDTALLLGDEDRACADLRRDPAPSAARVFCLARGNDWPGAERALEQAAETLPPAEAALLARFLDDETDMALPEITAPTPLVWRLLEAIGEPVATHALPVAFAHADLRGTAGWRAQIEAAERLTRAGALPANRLHGLYTDRSAAASGGIWERVRAVQRLESTLAQGDAASIGAALETLWPMMQAAELETTLAALYAEALAAHALGGTAARLAFEIGLLSPAYETIALAHRPDTTRAAFLIAVARGLPPQGDGGFSDIGLAVAEAFADPAPEIAPSSLARLEQGRLGEEVLRVLARLGAGTDPRMVPESLGFLRHVGLEDIARRAALQMLLLDRHG